MAFHTPEWLDAVCADGAWCDASRLYYLPDGRQFVLPLLQRRRWGAGLAEQASMPYGWGFGGVSAAGPSRPRSWRWRWPTLARASRSALPFVPTPWRRPGGPLARGRATFTSTGSAHVLDLSGGWDVVWASRFTGAARTAVRKAERQDVVVHCDDNLRLLPVFYALYEQSILRWSNSRSARWRTRRRDPLRKFRHVVDLTGPLAKIWVAWQGQRPIASIITLAWGRNMNYWRGAMDPDLAGPTRANYLLHRLAIEEACRTGRTTYHMGETAESSSLAQFKSRFGRALSATPNFVWNGCP